MVLFFARLTYASLIWSVSWSEFLELIQPKKGHQDEKIEPENVKNCC